MIIPKKVIKKEFSFGRVCNYTKDSHSLNGVEREVIKRLKEGNFDPRIEINDEIEGEYTDQGIKHEHSVSYGILTQIEEIRKITMNVLDRMGKRK